MAYFASNSHSLILIIFYSYAIFQSTNSTRADGDSWLWPDEVESKIDEHPKIRTDKQKQNKNLISFSFDEDDLAMRQERPAVIYQDAPFLVPGNSVEKNRRNSSTWKRLKTETKKPNGFVKPENQNLTPGNYSQRPSSNTQTQPSNVVENDWSFPQDKLPRRKAELKCAEYNKAVEEKDVWIHPLSNRPISKSKSGSGHSRCKGIQNPLIIGGLAARPGEFAHMAALGWLSRKNESVFRCGGSLISDRWVITAAHCTHGPSGPPKFVRVGARNLGEKATGRVVKVLEIVRHPVYKPPAVYADLALLKLDQTVKFGSDVKPACLYTNFDTTPLQAWATGWGVTGIGETQSDELLKVRLDVVDNLECALKLNRSVAIPRGIVPSMLCAGDVSGNWQRDTCQGDSGGPLQMFHPDYKCLHQIIGITSFGRSCALKNSPGVYTRISHYLDWIEGVVWPDRN